MRQQPHVASVSPPVALALVSGSLFLLTAIVGVLVAYDRSAAVYKFLLIVVGLASMVVLPLAADRRDFRRILILFAGAVILAGIVVSVSEFPTGDHDVTTEFLVLLLPMGIGAIGIAYTQSWRAGVVVPAVLVVLGFGILVAFGDSSALLALGVGACAGSLAFLCNSTVLTQPVRWVCRLLIICAGLLLAIYIALIIQSDLPASIVMRLPAALAERFEIWHEVLPIIADYRFTGSGLANSAMVYSTYSVPIARALSLPCAQLVSSSGG